MTPESHEHFYKRVFGALERLCDKAPDYLRSSIAAKLELATGAMQRFLASRYVHDGEVGLMTLQDIDEVMSGKRRFLFRNIPVCPSDSCPDETARLRLGNETFGTETIERGAAGT